MGKAKPVVIARTYYKTKGKALTFFNSQKADLYTNGEIESGALFGIEGAFRVLLWKRKRLGIEW